MINLYTYETVIGYITLYEEFNLLTKLCFGKFEPFSNQERYNETLTLKQAYCELTEYFNKKRTSFTIKFNLKGTSFQKSVWNELLKIPYGQTRSYCDRVIGKNGNLTGYRDGLNLKEFLLNLEK